MLNEKDNKIDKYITNIRDNNNKIRLIYNNIHNRKEIKIFDNIFIENNKDKCKIFYNDEIYDLTNKFNAENIEQLEIQLNGIFNITNMNKIFYGCTNLISLPDIPLINTKNVSDISYMFKDCSSLTSLSDISKWDTQNVTDMSYMFYGCASLSSLPDISKWDIKMLLICIVCLIVVYH